MYYHGKVWHRLEGCTEAVQTSHRILAPHLGTSSCVMNMAHNYVFNLFIYIEFPQTLELFMLGSLA